MFDRLQVRGNSWRIANRTAAMIDLSRNQIRDISSLVKNLAVQSRPEARSDNRVILKGNPLNDEAYEVHIPALQE